MAAQIVTLRDRFGTTARVRVDRGFNLFDFRPCVAGRCVEVLWSPDGFEFDGEPAFGGMPILFPFAGRIDAARFEYAGRQYQLEEGDGAGNAIHGFVWNRPWRLLQASDTAATGQFQASVDDPSLLARWPSDFRITARYELIDGRLAMQFEIDNPGAATLPFGLAMHPYSRLPLGGAGEAEAIEVRVPARRSWRLERLMPTGELETPDFLTSLRNGMTLDGQVLDAVLTNLESSDGRCETTLTNRAANVCLRQTFDASFGHCTVYTPPDRQAICIEPYTAVPNPFDLELRGIASGLRFLPPGESFTANLVMEANRA
ncbi:MAG: aldose 1-epimerase [Planctomycetales bacterium]|nr:aldose 1-epimerase [Planctomycetales bacterium]